MNQKLVTVLGLAFSMALVACQTAPTTSAPAADTTTTTKTTDTAAEVAKRASPTNLEELARRLVTQSAGVKEGEIVLISGAVRDLELLENIEIEVQKAGGHPLLTIGSERMTKKYFAEVPEKYDTQSPKLSMELAKIANVTINVDSGETEGLLADVPRARLAARAKTFEPVGAEFRNRKVRGVEVGNGLYPTEWRAKRFEMPAADFGKLFWEGVNVDYSNLQATGEKVKTALAGNEVHITHPNGTDLKVNIQGRPVIVSDGIISPEDVRQDSLNVYLPAGEVVVAPVAGSGQGKFVVDKTYFDGKEIQSLTLTFEGGKLTSMTGTGPGFAAMKADYDAYGAGKEILGYVDLGINPNIRLAPSSKLGNWVSAGMVTVGTGNNTWAGGTNNINGGVNGHLPGCTVKVDGKMVVENGILKA